METAKSDFDYLIDGLLEVFKGYNFNRNILFRTLFQSKSSNGPALASPTDSRKINKDRRLRIDHILTCMQNLYSEKGFISLPALLYPELTKSDKDLKPKPLVYSDNEDEKYKIDERQEHETNEYHRIQPVLDKLELRCEEYLSKFYNEYDPYPWIDLEQFSELYENVTNEDPHIFIAAHQLVYLITSIGLRDNNLEANKGDKENLYIDVPDELYDFYKNIKSFIVYGPRCSGKTRFVRHWALNDRSNVFYLDAKNLSRQLIFETLRPDYRFWTENYNDFICFLEDHYTFDAYRYNFENRDQYSDYDFWNYYDSNSYGFEVFINPWEHLEENPLNILHEIIPQDVTLIIDNVESFDEVAEYLNILPCKIVLVTDQKKVVDDSNLPVYELCTDKRLVSIFTGLYEQDIEETTARRICHNLGSDLDLYKFVVKNLKDLSKKDSKKASEYLDLLSVADQIEPMVEGLRDIKVPSSVSYRGNTAKGVYPIKFIENAYEDNLTDPQKRILHLLYRIQALCDNETILSKVLPYLDQREDSEPINLLIQSLINLGWLEEDEYEESLHIPLVIVAALNDISSFSNAEYSLFLNLMLGLSMTLLGLTNTPVDPEACNLLIQAIHMDFQSFIKDNGENCAEGLDKLYLQNPKNRDLDDISSFRAKGYPEDPKNADERALRTDPFQNIEFTYWLSIKQFYIASIYFCYQYHFNDLARELYGYAYSLDNILYKVNDRPFIDYDWRLQMDILSPDRIDQEGFSQVSFKDFANWSNRRKHDNKYPLITMCLKVIYDFQRNAHMIWDHELSDSYKVNPELRKDDIDKCSITFIEFSKDLEKYQIYWPVEENDTLIAIFQAMYNLLRLSFNLLAGIEPNKIWYSTDIIMAQSSAYQLCRLCYLTYYSCLAYYAKFIMHDDSLLKSSCSVLFDLCPEGTGDMPVNLKQIVEYAISIVNRQYLQS